MTGRPTGAGAIWRGLFGTWYNAVLTLLALWFLVELVPPVVNWAILSAKTAPDPAAWWRGSSTRWA